MTVNPVYIHDFIEPLIGGADSDEFIEKYGCYSADDKVQVIKLTQNVLLPHYRNKLQPFKKEMKNALAYYLYYDKADFESIFNSLLLPIETPKDSRLFFEWLWEAYFEGESYDFISKEDVVEDLDVEAPSRLIKETRQNDSLSD